MRSTHAHRYFDGIAPLPRAFRRIARPKWHRVGLLVVGLLVVCVSGCNRAFYRRQADRDVYALVDRAATHPRWPLKDFTIQPSPESRMFDPSCPDCPPQPPDDPTSHRLMHCVDRKWGWPHWRCYGKTPLVQSHNWKAYLPYDEQGKVALDREAAVRLALLESREYQRELEDLYLSALDVTFERFQFDTQFFGGNDTFFTADGPDRAGAGGSSVSELSTNTDLVMRKLLAGGGELAVGIANALVWQFAGPDDHSANTLLDFSLVQPLLRAGGRAVVLERLTDSERALLANIRQMERFRRAFHVQIVAGRTPQPGPVRGGIAIATVEPGTRGATVGGLLQLLEEQVRIRNQRSNVAGLQNTLEQLQAYHQAERVKLLQVDQARLSLLSSQIRLLRITASHEGRLDSYKITLGLPPDLDVRIADPLLRRFDLIEPELTATQEAVGRLLERLRGAKGPRKNNLIEFGACRRRLPSPTEAPLAVNRRRESPPTVSDKSSTYFFAVPKDTDEGTAGAGDYRDEVASIRQTVAAQLDVVHRDYEALAEALPERRRHLEHLADREEFRGNDVDPSVCDVDALDHRAERLHAELLVGSPAAPSATERLQTTLAALEPFEQMELDEEDGGKASREHLVDLLVTLSDELFELSLLQALVRLDTVTLVPVNLDPNEAFEIARANRRDWMNARAALVDTWRQIEIAANDLESDLDVVFSGDMGTVGDNPLRFRATTGRLRVGLEFDAPLTRLVERNAYRETQIAYQQARRQYYEFEDRVSQSLRATLRAIRLNQLNFELNRLAVRVAISQVDQARLVLQEPPRPGKGRSLGLGPTAARDLVQALSGLLSAQNEFLATWVDNEAQRLNLDLDLGTMRLDAHGLWIDPGPVGADHAPHGEEPEEIPVPAGDPSPS